MRPIGQDDADLTNTRLPSLRSTARGVRTGPSLATIWAAAGRRGRLGVWLALGSAGCFCAAVLLYIGAALLLGLLPLNADYRPVTAGVDVFIQTNGVHADLVVPIEAAGVNWRTHLPIDTLRPVAGVTDYLAFGWGDHGLYLTTPKWSDLRWSTALAALTGLDTSVMHVEAVRLPRPHAWTRHVKLSAAQYLRLVSFIEDGFRTEPSGSTILIPDAHYGAHDAFFEAAGRYSLFMTCNEWTRRGLAEAGVRVPAWAPFDRALFYQLPEVEFD